jgi:hypothetical protein
MWTGRRVTKLRSGRANFGKDEIRICKSKEICEEHRDLVVTAWLCLPAGGKLDSFHGRRGRGFWWYFIPPLG